MVRDSEVYASLGSMMGRTISTAVFASGLVVLLSHVASKFGYVDCGDL